ncbi:phage tail tape measure protein [Bacillus sp. FJAT-27225]|uniref:phage tail tape measure protein n=1 Tax=Bacillus sp. FJAT-27225 TaxID=1743144 RepID=UPI00080C32BF|nr:phage tail tape measure protein [Bacillus sp. FJAT-27225]OCA84484.1 phage tail tape measure protein [Bacillus sp. FJAT-27225]
MAEIGSLSVSLSLDASNFNGSIAQVDRNLKSMGSELKAVKAKGGDYGKSLDGLTSKKDILSRSLEASKIKLTETRKKYDEMVESGKANEAQLERQAKKVNDAQAQFNRLEAELKDVDAALKIQSSSWTQFSEKLAPIGSKLTAVGDKMTSIGKDLSMKVTAPIVGLGTAAFKAAVDFESAFAGVRKTVDTSEEGFKKLEKGIRDMAKELPTSANDIAAVAESAGQLGIAEESILSFSRTIIDLGESTNLTREQAASEFARFANIVGMSQNDFSKLGSSVVALGNNMATTEAEIMSMAMRLAAQGKQVGLSEAQIMALAGTMSSLGIEAEAGGTAMTTVLKKIQSAVDLGGTDLKNFAKASGMTADQFKKAFKEDAISALDTFIKGLSKSAGEGENLTAILDNLGIKGIRESDTILRMAGASDLLSSAVETSTKAWKENNALTNEAKQRYKTTASQIKIMWNQIKDLGIEMGGHLIPIVKDGIEKLQPLVKSFGDADDKTKKLILTVGGLVAAAGPLLVIGGTIMSGIGGTITAVSTLTGAIGAGGGLAATLTALSGPVGWTIGGIALLTGAIIGVKTVIDNKNEAVKKAAEVNLEHAESLMAEQQELEGLSEKYNGLKDKNKLSNDELLRYLDIQDQLKFATTAEEVKKLTDEQGALQKKSGLSNEELSEMLGLNDQLIKKVPDVDVALSDHGNAIIGNADAIGVANEKLRENIRLELENQRIKAEAKLDQNIRNYITALDELKAKEQERDEAVRTRNETEKTIAQLRIDAQKQLNQGKDQEAEKTIEEIARQEMALNAQNFKVTAIADEVGQKQKSVEKTEKEIQKTKDLYAKMIDLQLAHAGINKTGEEGIKQLDSAITKTQTRINELNNTKRAQGGLNSEQQKELDNLNKALGLYQNAKGEIQKIQGEQSTVNRRIDEGTGKASAMTKELGKGVTKNVNVDDKGKADDLNTKVSKAITKKVTLSAVWTGIKAGLKAALPNFFAQGTRFAPGGLAVVGEAGRELMSIGGGLYLANSPSLVNLPTGAKVIPNHDTEAILRKWNVPFMASGGTVLNSGVAYVGERGRELIDLGTGGGSKQLVDLLAEQNRILYKLLNKNQDVYISGDKVAEVVNSENAIAGLTKYF